MSLATLARSEFYRNAEVAELTGYHGDYIRQLVRKGRFPRPVPLGGPGGRA